MPVVDRVADKYKIDRKLLIMEYTKKDILGINEAELESIASALVMKQNA
jgi:hypothetical protein